MTFHDRLADGWSARYRRGGFARRRRFLETEILAPLPISGRWLDAGCGAGDFTHWLAARGAQARGLDASAAMIAAARVGSPATRFDQGLVEQLTDSAVYDGALCLSVLEYVDDPKTALARLSAAIRPGGHLILSAPRRLSILRMAQKAAHRLSGGRLFAYLASSHNAWGKAELVAALREHGLVVESLREFDPLLPRFLGPLASLWVATCRKAAP
ncbi:bifunctional 2-polyprenyl-6-hydroxyphenol methylase/3-demethylubiquinol 3-O-methyltransferase UbiG [Caulobacter sp. FWC2]|uniref:class I SAM-dependent methyltransferase n=1 Tax=Caulobacter sp. FWC2 TaxID=69664 RepID=UPI0013041793|nr:class I SAM-dependent methyltransferase [Caulobacter sp. FWC2]